jgi:hypothetical protein
MPMPAGLKRYWAKHRRVRHLRHHTVASKHGTTGHYLRGRTMRHHKGGMTLPVAALAGFIPLASNGYNAYKTGGMRTAGYNVMANLSGYDFATGQWNFANLKGGLMPLMAGFIVHKIVGGMLGVNRMLSRARVPFIRI